MVAAAARRRSSQRPAGSRPTAPLAGWLSGRGGVGRAIAGRGRDPGLGLCGTREHRSAPPRGAPPPRRAALRPDDPKAGEPGSCALADRAPGASALTGWVMVVRRGPWAERLLARGLPAEEGARPAGLGSGPRSGLPPNPRERARWRRGPGRGPGACGCAGRARRASAPSPAERPSRDGLVPRRPVLAGPQQGCVARVPGGRQAGVARPSPLGGQASRARSSPLAGKAGARPPRCGWVARAGRRRGRGRQGAGRGRTWKQGCESELAARQAEVAAPATRGGLAARRGAACVGADGGAAGRGRGSGRVGEGGRGAGGEAGKAAAAAAAS